MIGQGSGFPPGSAPILFDTGERLQPDLIGKPSKLSPFFIFAKNRLGVFQPPDEVRPLLLVAQGPFLLVPDGLDLQPQRMEPLSPRLGLGESDQLTQRLPIGSS